MKTLCFDTSYGTARTRSAFIPASSSCGASCSQAVLVFVLRLVAALESASVCCTREKTASRTPCLPRCVPNTHVAPANRLVQCPSLAPCSFSLPCRPPHLALLSSRSTRPRSSRPS